MQYVQTVTDDFSMRKQVRELFGHNVLTVCRVNVITQQRARLMLL